MVRSYGGDAGRVLDFVRSTIVAETVADVTAALKFVKQQAIIYTVKNLHQLQESVSFVVGPAHKAHGPLPINCKKVYWQIKGP